jgi:hypothetical protein
MVRAVRRRQALEALEFERSREVALAEQLEERVAELEGDRLDDDLFARLAPDDAEIVRQALGGSETLGQLELDDDDFFGAFEEPEPDPDAEREELEEEIARLESEIAESRRRQDAFRRYLDLLGAALEG